MKQPIFYPGKKLRAEDLINLEEYAFSRDTIVSPDHGVVSLYTNDAPRPEQISGKEQNFFIVREVTGITPSGRPISFKSGGNRMALSLPFDARGVYTWDIYIDDIHPQGKGDVHENEEKYKLSKQTVNNSDLDKPNIDSNKLYIGRYRLTSGEPPQIISPPYIYSLASFNFPTDWWQQWTTPIRQALREISEKHKTAYVEDFLRHIIYNYPFWPLSELLRSINQLSWLCKEAELDSLLDEGAMADLQQGQLNNPLPDSVYNIPPKDIPTKIGEILTKTFITIFWKLIPPSQYSVLNNTLIINKLFPGRHEIKFRFKSDAKDEEKLRDNERLVVDDFYNFIAPKSKEEDYYKKICVYYLIEYPGSQGGENFKLRIPTGWKIDSLTIYYRTLIETK